MSNTRCPSFNWLLIPLCAIVVGVLTMRLGVIELYLLSAYTIFVVAAHIHYGIRVVHPPLCTPFSTFIIIVTVVCFFVLLLQYEWCGAGMVVISLEQDADLHMAQLMPLPLTVSCFSKIQIGFTFLVLAHLDSPGKRPVKHV